MSATPKQLGSAKPSTTETTLCTIDPNSQGAVGIQISVANGAAAARTFRLYTTVAGTQRYMAYDESLAANASRTFAIAALGPGDIVGCRASTSDVDFIAFGVEVR